MKLADIKLGSIAASACLVALACGAAPAGAADALVDRALGHPVLQTAPGSAQPMPNPGRRALTALGEPLPVLLLAGGAVAFIAARARNPSRRR